jgi:hypothetical protein
VFWHKPVRTQAPKAPGAITFENDYPGTADQAKHVRADLARVAGDCPVLDELVLLASELATNAILHSRSGHVAGTFTVRATLYPDHKSRGVVPAQLASNTEERDASVRRKPLPSNGQPENLCRPGLLRGPTCGADCLREAPVTGLMALRARDHDQLNS